MPDLVGDHKVFMQALPSSADASQNRTWLHPGTSIRIYPDSGEGDNLTLWVERVDYSVPSDRILFRGDINNEINFTVPEGYVYAMDEGHFWNVNYEGPMALRDAAFFYIFYSVDVTGVDGVSDSFGNNSMLMRLLPGESDESRNRIWLYPGTSIRIYPSTDPATDLTLWVERVAYSVQ
jgi:hypothetical protein